MVLGRKRSGKTTLLRHLRPGTTGQQVLIIDLLGIVPKSVEGSRGLIKFFGAWGTYTPIAVRPQDDEDAERIFQAVRELGSTFLVIDEVDLIATPHKIGPGLGWIVRYGRHSGITLVVAFRRPAECSRWISAQANQVFTFNQTEPLDVKYLKSYGIEGVNLLPPYHVKHWPSGQVLLVAPGRLTKPIF